MKKNNKTTQALIARWQRRTGMWGILGLWTPFFAFLVWFGNGFFLRPLQFLLSGGWFKLIAGRYYSQPFPSYQTGTALDQPTVGKYLFWFLAFSILALSVAACIRIVSDMNPRKNRWAYGIPLAVTLLIGFATFLSPAGTLAHYIISMGITPKRLLAVGFLVVWAGIWLVAASLLFHRDRDATKDLTSR